MCGCGDGEGDGLLIEGRGEACEGVAGLVEGVDGEDEVAGLGILGDFDGDVCGCGFRVGEEVEGWA